MAAILIVPVVDEGLGNSAYLADLGDGRALAVDVPRDLRAVRTAAGRHRLKIAFAAETHLHADFLSGAVQLAADDDALILASAAGGRAFGHRGLTDGDEVDLGGLTLRAWATPGHTAEHLAYLLLDGTQVLGVFTGGSLLVGAVARTDLSGPEHAESLARAQYASLHRLLALPDATPVYPTHGAGSFCSAPPGAERTTTIGAERAANPLLAVPDEDAFVKALLASLGTFPGYFLRLPEENRRGPAVLASTPALAPLTTGQVRFIRDQGGQVIDVRPVADYAAGHIPGSLAIPLRGAFATWLGWLVPDPATPLVIVAGPGQDLSEVIWQALKIGYENLAGTLAGGMPAWQAAGQPVAATLLLTPGQVDPAAVIDVRQAGEYADGHLPGAHNIELGAMPGPFEAWLLQRGMRTLFLRVHRASETALAIATHFDGHPALTAVLYPGLPGHPGHQIAARQMRGGFGGMLSIRVAGGAGHARAVLREVRVFKRATSLGGVESLIEHRRSSEGPSSPVPDDLLRLSIGIEAPWDLIADLEAALDAAGRGPAPVPPGPAAGREAGR